MTTEIKAPTKIDYAYNYGRMKVQSQFLARAVSNYVEKMKERGEYGPEESLLMANAVDMLKLVRECEEELYV